MTLVWGAGAMQCRVAYTERSHDLLPPPTAAPYHRWKLPSGDDWITFHRDGSDYVLCFPDLAQFRVDARGRHVHCAALHAVPEATVRQLLNQVLPLVATGQRATVLHAGAVEVDDGAVAFLGRTGLGKSTLTAALAARGHRFLADDALQVGVSASGRPLVAPGQPQLRLWSDSARALAPGAGDASDATAKYRIGASERFPHCSRERPLTAIYLLGEDTLTTRFEPVRPAAALMELVRNAFLLDPESSELLQLQHDRLSALARQVPVFRLHYARNYARLPQVCEDILAHARACQPPCN